jgi:glycosyltransferase A (GT-A) superfamily protein (DUF2064 family)
MSGPGGAGAASGPGGAGAASGPGGAGAPSGPGGAGAPSGPAVLILARAPRRGQVRRALEPVLGAEGCVALQATLIAQAIRWAGEIAASTVHVAHDPPDAARELRALVGERTVLFPQNGEGIAARLADATARVFTRRPGPLLIVWPDLPRLRPEHAHGALEDLAGGADLVLGPAFDGGFYLIALPRPLPALFALPEDAWRGADAMSLGLLAARDSGLEVGILRAERALHRPSDLRAALADPMLPAPVARVLARAKPQ